MKWAILILFLSGCVVDGSKMETEADKQIIIQDARFDCYKKYGFISDICAELK